MKRFIPFFLTFVIVLSVVCITAPSASAREYLDYNDYITDITVDGDNDLITVELPVDQAQWGVWSNDEPVSFPVGSKLETSIYGVGKVGCWFSPNFIDLTNIPDDTVFNITFFMDYELQMHSSSGTLNSWLYYDGGNDLAWEIDYNLGTSTYSFTIDKTLGSGVLCGFIVKDLVPYNEYVDFYCCLESFTLQMSISSLYRLQQINGKTNELLDEVNNQLEAQGKNLEDILDKINGEADPVAPDQSGTVDDVVDGEGELLADAQTRWEESQRVFDGFSLTISTYGSTFLAVTAMLEKLFALDVFSMILYFSLSLGVLAVLLSIPMMVQSASRRKKGKGDG